MRILAGVAIPFTMLFLSGCGGGGSVGSSSLPVTTSPTITTPNNVQKATAAFSISIPLGPVTPSATSRSPQFVSPGTSTVYISLEDTPGHGKSSFSYTEPVNSTNCTTTSTVETCTFAVQMPLGSDSFSILTTNSTNVSLAYTTAGTTVTLDGANNATFGGQGMLSPIIAGATAAYAFQVIANEPSNSPPVPAVTVTPVDASGDTLSLVETTNAPYGDAISTVTATQTIGEFSLETNAHGRIAYISPPENSQMLTSDGRYGSLVETGNGTTSPFTTTLTLATPAVQYTQTELPQLPSATLTVPASASSLSISCQFLAMPPATEPCPGTASTGFTLH